MDTDRAHARKSNHYAIGMIAPAVAFAFALCHGLGADSLPTPLRTVVSAPQALPAAEPIRVRVLQLRSKSFSLAGEDIVLNGRLLSGHHAYKLKKFILEGAVSWSIKDRDSKIEISTVGDLKVVGQGLRLNLKPMPDVIEFLSRTSHVSDVVATLDIETYLRGVLPAEMPASWPMEALKAQAIAARTFALYRKAHQTHDGFDLDSDVSDQMFLNQAPSSTNAETAIRETAGVILEDTKHHPFAAYFHADCGGQTEEARNVWRLTLKQLSAKLNRTVVNVEAGARTSSGRLSSITLAMNDGTTAEIGGNEFRTALGYDQLKSTQFTVARDGDFMVFKGRGFGHGVGLCQWGAREMAKAGHSYVEILSHYYPKASLDRHPDLNDKESNGAHNEQAAQLHKESLPRSLRL
jgi:stage II sporulation protein D